MRLTCPNCDAVYEVDAGMIPEDGRDVQCSNCGNAWFQLPNDHDAERAAEAELYDDAPATKANPVTAAPEISPETAGDLAPDAVTVAEPAATPLPQPRGLDETVMAVLREEAERETGARRAEAANGQPVETQTEMNVAQSAVAGTASAATRRIAQLKGVDLDAPPARPPTRRDLLPEIDEINSSLRAASEKRTGESAAVSDMMLENNRGRGSFRTGFLLIVLVAFIAMLAYVMAPKIVAQMPGTETAMTSYVHAVDLGRARLDSSLRGLIVSIKSLTSGQK